ncbi:hypothetical protein PACTADRAFT_50021 [Pachysolen tannophilus NRRL Y-2460]|uniref:AMP deaminase n=1 Tax=Pachysolen tannophilus NRRL Y-2460 TaxID=669874 RepID=A0A1E4TU49_PACTA|nr:hypothetical protein PACTADRAFT_50021 [Pachysolen tannophilus NRRL Y-2460]
MGDKDSEKSSKSGDELNVARRQQDLFKDSFKGSYELTKDNLAAHNSNAVVSPTGDNPDIKKEKEEEDKKEDEEEDEDEHGLNDADMNRSISTHFSYTEDKMMNEHNAKIQAFEAVENHHHPNGAPISHPRKYSVVNPPPPPAPLPAEPSNRGISNEPLAPKNVKHTESHFKLGAIGEYDHNTLSDSPSDELSLLFKNLKFCRSLRRKYQGVSLQRFNDNPKNDRNGTWKIYPEPPKPTWKLQDNSKKFNDNDTAKITNGRSEFDFNKCEIPGVDTTIEFQLDDSDVYQITEAGKPDKNLVQVPTIKDYYVDLDKIITIASEGPAKSFAFKRLQYLDAKWNLYTLLNEYQETADSKKNPHRDFYNVRKVDTHVHHSACMNQKHLLRFIKHKIRHCSNEKVIFRDGKVLTLDEVFKSLNLTAYDLSIDTLDMHAHKDTFQRFDKFNLKYNPIGESRLREIFLKTDNYIKGSYLAEITQEVFDDLEQSKYQFSEFRISVYGRSITEWDKLAEWVIDNKLFTHNVRWLIQVPRLYSVYKNGDLVSSFHDIIINLFQPLYEVTKDPSSHPKLHVFLQRVVGFDSVDDESKQDRRFHRKYPTPKYWDSPNNPPYSYYLYYLFSNICSLNYWRQKRGFNTLVLRPHCGEAGDPEHLINSYLVSEGISHGILLRKLPYIQYLYYLDQIPIAMSPLSNNALFLTYDKNPFPYYFHRGLNVSLSTDDPLQFSYTREPLIEEYSVAAQIYKLSNVDLCELAKNSVMQSGFEYELKRHWLGPNFTMEGPDGNDIEKTNVPDIRVNYRFETLKVEHDLINTYNTESQN